MKISLKRRGKKSKLNRRVAKTIRFEEETFNLISAAAYLDHRTKTSWIEVVCIRALKELPKEELYEVVRAQKMLLEDVEAKG